MADGQLRFVPVLSVDTGGDVDATLAPPEGRSWRVLVAAGTHNDPVARNLEWLLYDGFTVVSTLYIAFAAVRWEYEQFYENTGCRTPIVLHYGQQLILRGRSIAVASRAILNAVILESRGLDDYAVTRGP